MKQTLKARTYLSINLILASKLMFSCPHLAQRQTAQVDTNPKNVLYLSQVGGRVFDSYVTGLSKCVGLPFFIRVFTWSPSGRVRS